MFLILYNSWITKITYPVHVGGFGGFPSTSLNSQVVRRGPKPGHISTDTTGEIKSKIRWERWFVDTIPFIWHPIAICNTFSACGGEGGVPRINLLGRVAWRQMLGEEGLLDQLPVNNSKFTFSSATVYIGGNGVTSVYVEGLKGNNHISGPALGPDSGQFQVSKEDIFQDTLKKVSAFRIPFCFSQVETIEFQNLITDLIQ